MRKLMVALVFLMAARPALAQKTPVADALRMYLGQFKNNLTLAVDDFPVAKFSYKPTAPQMSVAMVVEHLAGSNLFLCSAVSGTPAPTEAKVDPATASPDTLKARFKRSWAYCETALARLDDSKLADSVSFFGGKRTRAAVILALPYDWADHYSQLANYLRLNAISPPNARARAVPVK